MYVREGWGGFFLENQQKKTRWFLGVGLNWVRKLKKGEESFVEFLGVLHFLGEILHKKVWILKEKLEFCETRSDSFDRLFLENFPQKK